MIGNRQFHEEVGSFVGRSILDWLLWFAIGIAVALALAVPVVMMSALAIDYGF